MNIFRFAVVIIGLIVSMSSLAYPGNMSSAVAVSLTDTTNSAISDSDARELVALNVEPAFFRKIAIPRIATVTALDRNGDPLEGITIKASANGEKSKVLPKEAKTGSDGKVKFIFISGLVTNNAKITFASKGFSAAITRK
ncbi:MAG: hypothetical protein ACUZ8O_07285 [Candidatus Anammoxibacter sp.]